MGIVKTNTSKYIYIIIISFSIKGYYPYLT